MRRYFSAICNDSGEFTQVSPEYDPYLTVTEANNLISYLSDYVSKVKTDEYVEFLNWKSHKEFEERNEQREQEERERRALEAAKPKPPKPCTIYLIADDFNGYYKIGRTNNLHSRFSQLKTANAAIKLISSWTGIDADERMLHNHFSEKRIGDSEWFMLSQNDIEFIGEVFNTIKTQQ